MFSTPRKADVRGVLSKPPSHCIIYKLPKVTVLFMLKNIPKPKNEEPIFTDSVDWIELLTNSIAHELSMTFNECPDSFIKIGRSVANIISSVGVGTWSTGITPANTIKDIETNFPLYIGMLSSLIQTGSTFI